MNGAKADPPANIINPPRMSNTRIKGNNQNFFLVLRNPQRSRKISINVSYLISYIYFNVNGCLRPFGGSKCQIGVFKSFSFPQNLSLSELSHQV